LKSKKAKDIVKVKGCLSNFEFCFNTQRYHFKEEEAKLFDDFMQPMLRTDPLKRSTA